MKRLSWDRQKNNIISQRCTTRILVFTHSDKILYPTRSGTRDSARRVDVGEVIYVTQQQKLLLEYVAQELYTKTFYALTEAEHLFAHEKAEER